MARKLVALLLLRALACLRISVDLRLRRGIAKTRNGYQQRHNASRLTHANKLRFHVVTPLKVPNLNCVACAGPLGLRLSSLDALHAQEVTVS